MVGFSVAQEAVGADLRVGCLLRSAYLSGAAQVQVCARNPYPVLRGFSLILVAPFDSSARYRIICGHSRKNHKYTKEAIP